MTVVKRILRSELAPHWKRVALRLILTALVASGPYAFSMLGKWLVDDVLVVAAHEDAPVKTPAKRNRALVRLLKKSGIKISVKAKDGRGAVSLLWVFLGISLTFHVVVTALSGVSEFSNTRLIHRMTFNLRKKIHRQLYRLDGTTFGRESVGQLTARVMDDTAALPANLINLVVNGLSQGLMLAIGLVLLFGLDVKLSAFVLLLLPLYFLVCRWYLPKIRENSEQIRDRTAAFKGFILERLANVDTIKNYAAEPREIAEFEKRLDDNQTLVRTQQVLNLQFHRWRILIQALGGVAVVAFGFIQLRHGEMTLGEALAFQQITAHLFVPIGALVGLGAMIQNLTISANRIYAVLDAPVKLTDPETPVSVTAIKGDIGFDDVSMRFAEDGPFALDHVSFTIPAGSRVCIVGPTGCGKSTVISLLSRLYDPDSGAVNLDGNDLRSYRRADLRRAVGNVFQTCPVFAGTLAENVAFGAPDASPEEILAAADMTGLTQVAANLPLGFDTLIGHGGEELGASDLARLSFARALVGNPAIIAVDDTFSALDAEDEEELVELMRANRGSRTWIVGTSQLSLCSNADLVVVMHLGRVVQLGTHEELIATPGFYGQSYHRQSAQDSGNNSITTPGGDGG